MAVVPATESGQPYVDIIRYGRHSPRSSVLRSLPSIGLALSGCQRALRQAWHSVFPVGVQLSQPMPVDTRSVVFKVVRDSDLNIVAPVRKYSWTHVLAIDQECRPWRTIRCCGAVGDLEVVLPGNSSVWPVDVKVGADVETILPASSGLWPIHSALARLDSNSFAACGVVCTGSGLAACITAAGSTVFRCCVNAFGCITPQLARPRRPVGVRGVLRARMAFLIGG